MRPDLGGKRFGYLLIVVSEEGACGTSTNNATANGFPAITCITNTGIGQVSAVGGAFRIFPNPTNGLFSVDLQGVTLGANDRMEVLDISGRRVMSEQLRNGEVLKQIDLTAQPAGSIELSVSE